LEITRLIETNERIGVGSLITSGIENSTDVMQVKGVWKRERHVVIFHCDFPGYIGKEALLIVENEKVEWSVWSRVLWYLSFPFLPGQSFVSGSSITGSPV
jgi:hypothetical protein